MSIENEDGSIKEGFQLPYNPESFKVVEGTNERTVNIAGAGEIGRASCRERVSSEV